jgi:NitT/TauT family transport system ATP-binding protein
MDRVTMSAKVPLLVAQDLSFRYGDHTVFSQVNLSVAREEVVCLVGASGSGKSTLLRLLAGLAPAAGGQVRFEGSTDRARASGAGFVFQQPTLLPWLSLAENVAFGLDFKCRPDEPASARALRVGEALEQVGLAEHARKKPAMLSGGMAQRAALARALARDPEIIFLDEPFSALDAITRESMQDLLLQVARRHRSAVVLVTHDIDEALRIGDRVLLLSGKPGSIRGQWIPDGKAPRNHRSNVLNSMRDDILDALGGAPPTWFADL